MPLAPLAILATEPGLGPGASLQTLSAAMSLRCTALLHSSPGWG